MVYHHTLSYLNATYSFAMEILIQLLFNFKLNINRFFSIFFTFFFLFSCNSSKDKDYKDASDVDKVRMVYKKDFKLYLDSKTPSWSFYNQYIFEYDTKNEFIVTLNSMQNSLQFYNLNGKKVNETFYQKEGPNGVGSIQGFLYVNKESIFLLKENGYIIYRANNLGKVLDSYPLTDPSMNKYFTAPKIENGNDFFIKQNYLFIPGVSGVFYEKDRDGFYENAKLNIKLNLTNKEFVNIIPYPNVDKLISNNFSRRVITPNCVPNPDKNQLIYSFPADHYVYNYDTNGKLISKHLMNSKYLDEEIKAANSLDEIKDMNAEYLQYINNGYYSKLYYDKYRKIYFRFVKHGLTEEFSLNDFKSSKQPKNKYSVIISDENFDRLGEYLLDNGLGAGTFLVTKDGILIKNLNNTDENSMLFSYFEIGKN